MEAQPTSPRWISVSERLPTPGEMVRYRTLTFRSAGRCDAAGKWTTSTGQPETEKVIEWLEE